MNTFPALRYLCTFSKTHGIKGGLVLRSEENLPENIEKTELVFVEFDNLPVPFFIEEAELTSPQSALIFLKSSGTPVRSFEFPGRKVFVPDKGRKKKKIATDLSILVGYLVVDVRRGELGKVEEIVGIATNPLFRIIHHRKEILIPIQEPIIQEIDARNKKIHILAPDGLIDLFIK
jgi:16S rRNA processing protein RimM